MIIINGQVTERETAERLERRIASYFNPDLVIGRITQPTPIGGIPLTCAGLGSRWTRFPSGRIVWVTPMHHLYVYRQDGRACMILTRLDPFHYEHLSLSDLEMEAIISWAKEMAYEVIGKFTPADGGWFWWAE